MMEHMARSHRYRHSVLWVSSGLDSYGPGILHEASIDRRLNLNGAMG